MTYGYYGLGVADTVDAKPILVQAWQIEFGRDPTPTEVHAALAIARHETGYGEGWKGLMKGSRNWGALMLPGSKPDQSKPPEQACPPGSALAGDFHPDGQAYGACFKTYASDLDGARDLLRRLTAGKIFEALGTGDALQVAKAQYATFYFQGRCELSDPGGLSCGPEPRIRRYAEALARNAKELAAKLGEPVLVTMPVAEEDSSSLVGGIVGGGILGLFIVGTLMSFRSRK